MTESTIEKALVAHCKARGLLTYKFSSPAHRGVPDRVIMGGGKLMFIELKRPGKEPTPLQQRELQRIREAGVHAYWSSNIDNLRDWVDDFFAEVIS